MLTYIISQRAALSEKRPYIIAIDGQSASGKTTAAAGIAQRLCCPVIHMDSFFLPPELRTEERMSRCGGNIDHERLLSEVIDPMLNARDFSYAPYDCAYLRFLDKVCVPASPIYIVEGAYSLLPALGKYYDLSVFVTIDRELQQQRILERNGQFGLKIFTETWIPREEEYFAAFSVKERCDIVF